MARPTTVEEKKLASVNAVLEKEIARFSGGDEIRLTILEYVSCSYSGISVGDYYEATGYEPAYDPEKTIVRKVISLINTSGIPVSIALSSLSRIKMSDLQIKKQGSVYTDFRLARYLAGRVMPKYTDGAIVDPSCGTAILLAACAEFVKVHDGNVGDFVASSLCGVDLEPLAIRGSILVLSTFLSSVEELDRLLTHFACGNSLAMSRGLIGIVNADKVACVIGNPPWERMRPSRSEFAREHGLSVVYGEEIENLPDGYEEHRNERQKQTQAISSVYEIKGGVDLYRAFLSLSIDVCGDDGLVALYLPAGLIRSMSLAEARESIARNFDSVELSIFTNHSKFFAIDSRFKFVLASLCCKNPEARPRNIQFLYCDANDEVVENVSKVKMPVKMFCDSSRKLGAPEVKNNTESRLLKAIWDKSDRMIEHEVFAGISPVRELDMTLDRKMFKRTFKSDNDIPLIEGRMVSPFLCGSKKYLSGKGRSAKWEVNPLGLAYIFPQFYVSKQDLEEKLLQRISCTRVGFCDIAGQTNERAMQAALIPSGCVCGNKVPTLLFSSEEAAYLWLGIVNSFTFDWVVRRYITNTINFFILQNLPFPQLNLGSDLAESIIADAKRLSSLENNGSAWSRDELWDYALTHAKLNEHVLHAYGLGEEDFEVITCDFPLVDRLNFQLSKGSSVTFDLIRYCLSGDVSIMERVKDGFDNGAMPFVSNERIRGNQH